MKPLKLSSRSNDLGMGANSQKKHPLCSAYVCVASVFHHLIIFVVGVVLFIFSVRQWKIYIRAHKVLLLSYVKWPMIICADVRCAYITYNVICIRLQNVVHILYNIYIMYTQFVVWSHPYIDIKCVWCVCGRYYIRNGRTSALDEVSHAEMKKSNSSRRSSISNHQFLAACSGNNVLMLCKITNTFVYRKHARTHITHTQRDKRIRSRSLMAPHTIDIFDLAVFQLNMYVIF